jgi:hypothetical protein
MEVAARAASRFEVVKAVDRQPNWIRLRHNYFRINETTSDLRPAVAFVSPLRDGKLAVG